MKIANHIALAAALSVSLFKVTQVTAQVTAQLGAPAILMTTVRQSAVGLMATQAPLVQRDNGRFTTDDYERQATGGARVERNETLRSSLDGGRITIDNYGENFISTPSLASKGGSTSARKIVPLGAQAKIQDPETGASLIVNAAQPAGSVVFKYSVDNTAQTIRDVATAAGAQAIDFADRQKQIDTQRERFTDYFKNASVETQRNLERLRAETAALQSAGAQDQGLGAMQMVSGLLSQPNGLMTGEERAALSIARDLTSSELRHVDYAMNREASRVFERELTELMRVKNYRAAARILETLDQAVVDGQRFESKVAHRFSNASGILKTNGPFDARKLKTEARSSEGQIIRRLMNRYQAMWADSDALSVLSSQEQARFLMGMVAISESDNEFANGNAVHASGLASLSEVLIDSIAGFGAGLGQSVSDLVRAVPELASLAKRGASSLVNDPVAAWKSTVEFISNLDQVAGAMLLAVQKDYKQLKSGSAFERGEIAGKYFIDVVALVASGGAAEAANGISKAGGVAKAVEASAEASKIAARATRTLAKSTEVSEAVHVASASRVEGLITAVDALPESARQGLENSLKHNPSKAVEIAGELQNSKTLASPSRKAFMEKVAAAQGERATIENVHEMGELYDSASDILKSVKGVEKESVVSRAIRKEIIQDGKIIHLEPSQVFELSPFNEVADHRFSIGGPLGEKALYVGEGSIAESSETLARELGVPPSEMWIDQRPVHLENMLDLTDQTLVDRLKGTHLQFDPTAASHDYTQVIGSAAREAGFSGVIFPSVKNTGFNFYAIFK